MTSIVVSEWTKIDGPTGSLTSRSALTTKRRRERTCRMAESKPISPDLAPSIQGRFWSKVNKDGPVPAHSPGLGPCWLWTASKRHKGYGAFAYRVNGIPVNDRAHRYSYRIHVGPVAVEQCVLHRCDVPACVNPEHLWVGTRADNNADMAAKGRKIVGGTYNRAGYRRGEAHGMAKLTTADVLAIRADRTTGLSYSKLAAKYGIGIATAFQIVRGALWPHVGKEVEER